MTCPSCKLRPCEFRTDTQSYRPKCRECRRPLDNKSRKHKGINRRWYEGHKDYVNNHTKEARKRKQTKKMRPCSFCHFMPLHAAQMDWDHINGRHSDNRPENLQLLCANCHRLKTILNGDHRTPS